MPLRVIFAEDNYLVREGTTALLAEVADIDLVGSVADPEALVLLVRSAPAGRGAHRSPDATVVHHRGDRRGPQNLRRASRHRRRRAVAICGGRVRVRPAQGRCRRAGLSAQERLGQVADLVHALQEVARGGSLLDPRIVEGLLARGKAAARSPLASLTDRERSVLEEMAAGATNATIARRLFLSDRAVEKNMNTLFAKLGLSEETDGHRRVLAVLTFLGATGAAPAR